MLRILAAVLLLLASALLVGGLQTARAQGLPALAAAATAPPAAPAAEKLTPQETQLVLDVLNDPAKRAAFTATLQTMVKAAHVAAPEAAKPAAAVPLAPNSVGAELLQQGTSWLGGLSGQLAAFGRVLGDLPSVWRFTRHTLQDPVLRARALDTSWRLAAILLVAGLVEYGAWLLLRRPTRALAAHGPTTPASEPLPAEEAALPALHARPDDPVRGATGDSDEPGSARYQEEVIHDEHVAHVLNRRRFSRTLRTLQRLPFVLLRLVLDLIPLGLFVATGYAGMLFAAPQIQDVLQAAIVAYAACRMATSVTRMLVSPDAPSLRLFHLTDQASQYCVVWVRRIFAVGAFGFAAAQIGLLFGLPTAAQGAFLKLVFLLVHLFLVIIVLQCRAPIAALIRGPERHTIGGRVRQRLAAVWHLIAIFYIVGLWLVWAAEVHHGYLRIWHLFLTSCAVLLVARVAAILILGGLDRAFRISAETSTRYPGLETRANRYYPILRGTITAVMFVVTGLALLQAWGLNTIAWFRANALGGRLVSASITILIAAMITVAVWEVVNSMMDRHLARLTREAQMVKSARLRTLLPILRTVLMSTLIGIFGLTALSEIGVNIAPLLAGAGILGVAIGFGSQKLVQDFITGIFLLLENAMQVGDWVTVAGLSGSVENLSIRTMRLRAGDGSVHIIPFSSVSTVTNVNRGIGNAAVTVNVPITEDTDHVSDVLGEIARVMRGERRFADMMRSDFQLWGVDKVDAGVVTIVGQIVCTDSGRWAVQREFNRRMNIRFKEAGIHIATPVTTVYNHVAQQSDKPVRVAASVAAPPSPDQVVESPPPAALGNTS
jgi:small-conductance mechanosensitive channel